MIAVFDTNAFSPRDCLWPLIMLLYPLECDIRKMGMRTIDDTEMLSATQSDQSILYEQPLNEAMRIFLRLDHLFANIHCPLQTGEHRPLETITEIIKILNVTDRPDLKSKLTQVLTQQATTFGQLNQFPQVDSKRLSSVMTALDKQIEKLHHLPGKFGDVLRNNDLLNQVKLQSANPSGICHYQVPVLALWLKQPYNKQQENLNQWIREFTDLSETITLILNLIRSSTNEQTAYSENGFYQQTLNSTLPSHLLRIEMPLSLHAYPKFSVGQCRLTIRFLTQDPHNQHSSQLTTSFPFKISLCRI